MKLRPHRWLPIVLLAQAAHAADMTLEITPPEPEWLVPRLNLQPCFLFGLRIEACEMQVLPEGMHEVGESALVVDLAPLLAAGDYEAVLNRAWENFGTDLALLEAGDFEGFLATRMPTDGRPRTPGQASVAAVQASARFSRARSDINNPRSAGDDGQVADSRPVPRGNPGSVVIRQREPTLPDYISATVLYALGHTYLAMERYLPAETAFRLVLVPLPDHVRAHESLGMIYLRTERYAEAREHLAQAVELGRNTAQIHAALGYLEQKTRHYYSAASAFQQVLVREPGSKDAKRGLLNALTETREREKATALLEELLDDEPNDPALWLYRAQMAITAGERASAIASLETALRLGDDSVANRATCLALHMESGNVSRALELLQGSAARDFGFPFIDQALGWLANENEWNGFRELLGQVDRATLGGAEQSRLLTRRASLALHDGNRRAASTALQEALTLDPSNANALMALGQIYRADRDYGRADLVFDQASATQAVRESALVAQIDVAIDQENFDRALVLLRDVVVTYPARADLRRNVDLLENLVQLRTEP